MIIGQFILGLRIRVDLRSVIGGGSIDAGACDAEGWIGAIIS